MLSQSRIRIEVKGRAQILCDPGHGHVLAVKFIVSVLEVMHKIRITEYRIQKKNGSRYTVQGAWPKQTTNDA
jgi:hypothetical protein